MCGAGVRGSGGMEEDGLGACCVQSLDGGRAVRLGFACAGGFGFGRPMQLTLTCASGFSFATTCPRRSRLDRLGFRRRSFCVRRQMMRLAGRCSLA